MYLKPSPKGKGFEKGPLEVVLHDTQPLGSMRSSREALNRLGKGCQGSAQEGGQAPIWRAKGRGLEQMEGKLQLVAVHFHV